MNKTTYVTTDEGVVYIIDKSEKLGEGQFGTVYNCQRENNPRKFAAKTIPCYTKKNHDRILTEIEMHKKACSENVYVTKLIDYVITDNSDPDTLYDPNEFRPCKFTIIIEKMDMDLRGLLEKRPGNKLKEKEAQFYFIQLLEGLKGFSRDQIMHRDLKLENIMIRNKRIKFVDFGMATKEALGESRVGSPLNMPPWLLRVQKVKYDRTVDLYALGLILFEMVTGFHPYERDFNESGGQRLLDELAEIKEDNSGENLFSDKKFYRSKGFKPKKDISPELKHLLEYMITLETQQRTDFKINDLYEKKWISEAITKYDKFYRLTNFKNNRMQLDLINSQFKSSIFKSMVTRKIISNPIKQEKFGKLEQYHLELQNESNNILKYLQICEDEIFKVLNWIKQSRRIYFNSNKNKFEVKNLLKRLLIFVKGNMMYFGKEFEKEAFTSSGFIDYLESIHGKQVYKMEEMRRFFREVLNDKEDYQKQKRLAQDNSKNFFNNFEQMVETTDNTHFTFQFQNDIIRKIQSNNWEDFENAEKTYLDSMFKDLLKINNKLFKELNSKNNLMEELDDLEYEDDEATPKQLLNLINRGIYSVIYKLCRFNEAKRTKDFLDLDLFIKETDLTSSFSLKLDLDKMFDDRIKINNKPVMPFFVIIASVILVIIFFLAVFGNSNKYND